MRLLFAFFENGFAGLSNSFCFMGLPVLALAWPGPGPGPGWARLGPGWDFKQYTMDLPFRITSINSPPGSDASVSSSEYRRLIFLCEKCTHGGTMRKVYKKLTHTHTHTLPPQPTPPQPLTSFVFKATPNICPFSDPSLLSPYGGCYMELDSGRDDIIALGTSTLLDSCQIMLGIEVRGYVTCLKAVEVRQRGGISCVSLLHVFLGCCLCVW